MAECLLLKGGGGGTTSDELTATRANVEVGKTAVTKDSDDEAATGTLRNITNDTTIDHASNNSTPVVVGDQAYISTNTDGVTRAEIRFNGTRGVLEPNTLIGISQGAMASAGGLIASKLMKNQSAFGISGTATSDATATAAYIRSGYTAYVNGSKITGTMTVSSLVSFSVATYSTTQVTATWKWPSVGPYSGIAICGKTGGYPSNINDHRVYTGHGSNYNLGASTSAIIGGLSPNNTYYFRAWVYCNTSEGDLYSNYSQATAATKPQGQQTFTSSGIFTVPSGVTQIDIFCVGGGGGGSQNNYISSREEGGSGGGGGYTRTIKKISVIPGTQYTVTVGAGAAGGDSNTNNSDISWSNVRRGGTSSVGSLCSSAGGFTARSTSRAFNDRSNPGSGGSSGGFGYSINHDGKSDGGNCYNNERYNKNQDVIASEADVDNIICYGQGTTTRAWGDSNGTLYAGGGGGGGWTSKTGAEWWGNGAGGSGGGGHGGYYGGTGSDTIPANGSVNTGGGGGGAGTREDVGNTSVASGGSGIVLIRWGY